MNNNIVPSIGSVPVDFLCPKFRDAHKKHDVIISEIKMKNCALLSSNLPSVIDRSHLSPNLIGR